MTKRQPEYVAAIFDQDAEEGKRWTDIGGGWITDGGKGNGIWVKLDDRSFYLFPRKEITVSVILIKKFYLLFQFFIAFLPMYFSGLQVP